MKSGKGPIFFIGGKLIVVMNQSSTEEDIEKVKEKAIQQGHEPLVIYGVLMRLIRFNAF